MAVARNISRNMAALSFAEIVSKGLQFLIMVYAARLLDKDSFGIFSFALYKGLHFFTGSNVHFFV